MFETSLRNKIDAHHEVVKTISHSLDDYVDAIEEPTDDKENLDKRGKSEGLLHTV